jgi:hypothetical protein
MKSAYRLNIDMKIINTLSTIFMILVVAACAQTTATKSTSQQKEETRQTSPPSRKTSSETTGSAQQESQTKSESGEAATTEATAGQKAEAARMSPAAAESESQQFEPESSTRESSAQDSADAKLAEAQEKLRISQETEKRIAEEFEQLKASGSASEEAVRDYETYLKSVEAMTAENRKVVEQMQAAYDKKSSGETGSDQPSTNEPNKIGDPDIPEEQVIDEVTALDRQLNASLAKFDGMLLEEMDEIRAGSSKKLQDLAEEAAEAAKRLREKGLDVDTSGSKEPEDSREGQEGGPNTDQEMESRTGRTGTDGSRKGEQGPSRTDQRRADYEDDDIVARQLREAAENETDPELKEKLWKEYEEYKKTK